MDRYSNGKQVSILNY